jgi:hypothetical protein
MFAIGIEPGAGRTTGLRWLPSTPPGPPMDLGNMRHPGVQRLVAHCLDPMSA